jgi:hypothetical protein
MTSTSFQSDRFDQIGWALTGRDGLDHRVAHAIAWGDTDFA